MIIIIDKQIWIQKTKTVNVFRIVQERLIDAYIWNVRKQP